MTRLRKISTNIFCLFIWHRPTRHKVHDWLNDFELDRLMTYLRYVFSPLRSRSVLLIELNNCHGEVIGGIIPYFQKLGMNIDIMINSVLLDEKNFCRQDMKKVRIYPITKWRRCFLTARKTRRYPYVFLMTSACYYIVKPDGGYGCMLPLFDGTKLKPFVVEHDLNDVAQFGEEEMLRENRLITLGKFDRGIYVNPHLFGTVNMMPKHGTTTFIVVGNIEAKRKNFNLLTDALTTLAAAGKDFKVIVIGRGTLDALPANVRPHIEITGRLDFEQMFDKLESADFFLPLLDPENPAHDRYLTTGVTGSAQLIYGFGKIPVIHKKFAAFYRFNDSNAVIYENDLADAMSMVIDMTPDEYATYCANMKATAAQIANESLKNLKEILS